MSQLGSVKPAAAQTITVDLTVNGTKHRLTIDPRSSLLDTLREALNLTGTKKACDHGQCGACTVLVDNRRVLSCLSFAVMYQGKQITTIEGIADGDTLHPMQEAFIKNDGFQCGFCTSGQICSAIAMLKEHGAGCISAVTDNVADTSTIAPLTEAEIKERMSGNICRCAAYSGIVAAIQEVARAGSEA